MICHRNTILLFLFTTTISIISSEYEDHAITSQDADTPTAVMSRIAEEFSNRGYICLYSESRNTYTKKITPDVKPGPAATCPFCAEIAAEKDDTYFILKRGQHVIISLNPYPYIAGHMMVIPYAHKGQLRELTPEARAEWAEFIMLATSALKDTYDCPGIQMGSNFGECAGASIPGHLHTHIIPTSKGHQAAINILGNTVVITKDLPTVYNELKPYFENNSHDHTAH